MKLSTESPMRCLANRFPTIYQLAEDVVGDVRINHPKRLRACKAPILTILEVVRFLISKFLGHLGIEPFKFASQVEW